MPKSAPLAVEDRFGINDLFVRYTTALDAGNVDTIVDCFTEDGALESPVVGKYSGHAGIRAFSERFAALHERGVQLRHVISNLAMTVDGDTARDVLSDQHRHGRRQIATHASWALRMRVAEDRWAMVVQEPAGRPGRAVRDPGLNRHENRRLTGRARGGTTVRKFNTESTERHTDCTE